MMAKCHRRPARRVFGYVGVLERHEQTAPNFDRVLQALQAGSEFFPFVMAEIGMARAGREDQIIIGNLALVVRSCFRRDVDRATSASMTSMLG